MMPFPARVVMWLRLLLIVAVAGLASPLASRGVLAQAALYPGATALVANTGGDPVLLRETPSFDAAVVASFSEGTTADVLEGPVSAADGVVWYGVAIGGMTGYVVGGYLAENVPGGDPAVVELAQTAAPDAVVDPSLPAPVASLTELPAAPVATADLNLRAGPSYGDAVLTVIPAGAALTTTGEFWEGFAGVTYAGQYGWVDTSWLGGEAAPEPSQDVALLQGAAPVDGTAPVENPAETAVIGDLAAAPAGETVTAIDVVNLRAGPSAGDEILRVIPPGGVVTIAGAASDGWAPVWYNGTWGFIRADLLSPGVADSVSLAQEAMPVDDLTAAPAPSDNALQATVLSDVNLRDAPDLGAGVLLTIPTGAVLTTLAGPEQGFYQVQYGDQTGWAAAEFLEVSAAYLQRGDREGRQEGKVEGSEPADNLERGAGGIIWPVSGGLWNIMQGYNGSSHQNQDGLWQYYYSLDLERVDGNSAGQQVISPVNGEVRWTDPSSGGISIDIGNGHAVAMFHVDFMNGLEAGTAVRQGQYLGEISGPGGPGFAGVAHLHFTLWTSDDSGNWDREAVPFTGRYAINGMDFPDTGGRSQHAGTEFRP